MKSRSTGISIIICLLLSSAVVGQIPWFSAIPMLYNPSFAGGAGNLRVSTYNSIQRTNWHSSGKDSSSMISNMNYISVDHFIGKIHTGVGMYIKYVDSHGTDGSWQNELQGSVSIAPKFSFREKFTISPSLQIIAGETWFNYPAAFKEYSSQGAKYSDSTYSKMAYAKLGLMYNSKKLFLGLSILAGYNYVYTPVLLMSRAYSTLGVIGFIGGYTFKKKSSEFSFTPVLMAGFCDSFLYNFTYNYPNVNLYLNFKYRKFMAGVDLDLNWMLGYEKGKFRIMLLQNYLKVYETYNINMHTGYNYSAQISLRYIVKPKNDYYGFR